MSRRGVTLVELVSVVTIIGVMVMLLLPAVLGGHEAARAVQCQNSMKQLSLALLNYHDTHDVFPAGYIREPGSGKCLESWGVETLRFAEQSFLSTAIDHSVEMGMPENLTVRVTLVSSFLCPSNPGVKSTMTVPGPKGPIEIARSSFVGSYGTGDPLSLERGDGMFSPNYAVRIDHVLDGTSTTFLLGERRSDAGPTSWAGPVGKDGAAMVLGSTLGNPGPNQKRSREKGFSSRHEGGANFVYVDGSVRFVADSIAKATYNALATRRGGEVIGDFEN